MKTNQNILLKQETIPLFKTIMAPSESLTKILTDVFNSGMTGEGDYVKQFECLLSDEWNHDNILLTNSCTSSLTLAIQLANHAQINPIWSSPFTMVATNTAIITSGFKVKWCKVDPATLCIDLKWLMDQIKNSNECSHTVVLTLVAGNIPLYFKEFLEFCSRYNVYLIIDAAHAYKTFFRNKHISHYGDCVCFSFQSIKHLNTIDGGALVCNRYSDYLRAEKLKWFGMSRLTSPGVSRLEHQMTTDIPEAGWKFHMNNVNAAIGIENIKVANKAVIASRENASMFNKHVPEKYRIVTESESISSNWVFGIHQNDKNIDPIDFFSKKRIAVSYMWPDNSRYSCFKDTLERYKLFDKPPFFIPNGVWLTEDDKDFIVEVIQEYYK